MRTLALAIALLGLMSLPGAIAEPATAPPPASLAALRADDGTLLAWSPVPGGRGYQILAGDSPDTLVPIATTAATAFVHATLEKVDFYGVATMSASGSPGLPNVLQVYKGDCVSTSTKAQMSVSLHSCWESFP